MHDYFLADDLSGALDAAAAFHRTGRRVRIAVGADGWPQLKPDEILGITTETRNTAPAEAASVLGRSLARAAKNGGRLLYKKIDSTLRGPVAAEMEALMEAMPGTRVLFAPANPRVGRTVRDGVLLVRGTPVAETDFGRDPAWPLRESAIRRILGPVATPSVVIPDVATEADLAEAVRQMDASGQPWVPIGSGALAGPVAARGDPGPRAQMAMPAIAASPVLMIGGSAHPLNRSQAEKLTQTHRVNVHVIAPANPAGATHDAIATLQGSGGAILQLPPARIPPATALRAIVDAAAAVIADARVRRVFATGGETAFALCERLGIRTLAFLDEIEPGVCLSHGEGPAGPLLLAVKPGGFGDADTWVKVWERLKRA